MLIPNNTNLHDSVIDAYRLASDFLFKLRNLKRQEQNVPAFLSDNLSQIVINWHKLAQFDVIQYESYSRVKIYTGKSLMADLHQHDKHLPCIVSDLNAKNDNLIDIHSDIFSCNYLKNLKA